MKDSLEARLAKLEGAIAQMQDERAIRDLIARYAINTDAGRLEEFLAVWTEDGIEEIEFQGKVLRWAGKSEIRAWRTGLLEQKRAQPNNRMHVHGNDLIIHINGSEATANSYTFGLGLEAGKVSVTSHGAVRWTFRKINGQWLIKEKKVREMNSAEFRELLAATPR